MKEKEKLPRVFYPDYKIKVLSDIESRNPDRYRKKDILQDSFSKIYFTENNQNKKPVVSRSIDVNKLKKVKISDSMFKSSENKITNIDICLEYNTIDTISNRKYGQTKERYLK